MKDRALETDSIHLLTSALYSFKCYLDKDIESFLPEKSFDFLDRNWCSVYLIVDEHDFDNGRVTIEAYFTLSHKTLVSPPSVSKSKVKNISGFSDSKSIHFVLIGQLGKYVNKLEDGTKVSANITSSEILDFAFELIRASSNLIPCRCVLVECNDVEKVHRVYLDYGFKYFQYDGSHHQFYKQL